MSNLNTQGLSPQQRTHLGRLNPRQLQQLEGIQRHLGGAAITGIRRVGQSDVYVLNFGDRTVVSAGYQIDGSSNQGVLMALMADGVSRVSDRDAIGVLQRMNPLFNSQARVDCREPVVEHALMESPTGRVLSIRGNGRIRIEGDQLSASDLRDIPLEDRPGFKEGAHSFRATMGLQAMRELDNPPPDEPYQPNVHGRCAAAIRPLRL